MRRHRTTRLIASYVLSLLVTIALLVVWVVYVVRSVRRVEQLAGGFGLRGDNVHWVVLGVGLTLLFLLLSGLTYQLAQSLAELRYSQKQEDFVSNITHEMKSPLAAIKLHAQTLEQGEVRPSELDRSVSFILQQVERMEKLVDDVLESSRLVARRRHLELVQVSLAVFFETFVEEARAVVEGHGLSFEVELGTNAIVLATTDALRRVMTNLLDNAVHFSARGGVVRCRVRDSATRVSIEVEDDGVGIPHKELGKIFDRFYQISREWSGRWKGTGLGLAIVDGLVREMKGTVRAVSQEGRPGTRFVVELPIAEVTA